MCFSSYSTTPRPRLQDAVFQEQLVDYRNMVIEVQGEVENAIVAYLKSHEQVE